MKTKIAKVLDAAFVVSVITLWYLLSRGITTVFKQISGREMDTSSIELMLVIIPGVVIWAYSRHIYFYWIKTRIGLRNFGFLKPKGGAGTRVEKVVTDHIEPN